MFVSTSIIAQQGPTNIYYGKLVKISPKISEIKYAGASPRKEKSRSFGEKDPANKRVRFAVENPKANSKDDAAQSINMIKNRQVSTPSLTFDGCVSADNITLFGSTFAPPDQNLSVGPNHVVQMVNSAHKIWDKSGNLLAGPIKFSSIASNANDDGDPIVLYDQLADRWMILQFNLPAGSESLIFCISQTNDPTGAYYVYEFLTPGVFPDYPHIGIWNDSYVITTHEFNLAGTAYLGQGFYTVDRKKMIEGQPTSTLIRFQVSTEGGYLPASFEGLKTPESTSPAMFTSFDSDEFGGNDELWIRTISPNYNNPASSTLSARTALPVAAFDGRSPSSRSVIEQSGTTSGLDAIADRMMSRVIYRRFDNYESLVMNYAVNVSGVNPTTAGTFQAAMRWYELTRATPASAWTINQQSTYAPTGTGNGATGDNRWMGSIGIDQKGNMAMGYSKSSSSTFPSIYYAERRTSDPLSQLSAEQEFFSGTGSQVGSGNRWGDYTSMVIDPTDEETLWYTNEYYSTTTSFSFKTRIGKFKIEDPQSSPTVHFKKGGTIARQVESVTPLPPNRFYKDYPIELLIDQAPSQNVNITFSKTGTATEGVDYDLIIPSPFILSAGNTSQSLTLRVYDDIIAEADEFIDLTYTMNVNGGNAVAATYNQKHRITIIGKTVCPSINVTNSRPLTFCEGDSTVLTANFDPNYTFQWFKNSSAISGATAASLVVKEAGTYHVAITNANCTLPSTSFRIMVNLGVPAPTTVSRTVTTGTIITTGNGLQASGNCISSTTVAYSGPTVGYDGGNSSGTNPVVNVSGLSSTIKKVRISITWRKKRGGNHTSCSVATLSGNPFNEEVSFQLLAPNGSTINVLDAGTYLTGGNSVGNVTTVFEDGASTVGTVPASGTFAPTQSFVSLIGTSGNGNWTLIPNDNGAQDPLCVEAFSVTIFTVNMASSSTINWFSAASGGSSLGTGSEYIPTDTAPGIYTYYAEASCSDPNLVCTTSIRVPSTLTITANCVTNAGSVSANATVCSGSSGTLTLSGHTGNVLRWESSSDNFNTITQISNTTATHNYTNITATTQFRAVVQNGTCTATNSTPATISVISLSATASNSGPYTTGQTIQLSATGGSSYNWTGPNSFTSTSNPTSISGATLAMSGVYTVTAMQGSCTASATTNVVVTSSDPCATIVEYDYVQAGNPFVYKFPLTNNMVIAEVPEQTSILVKPVCPTVPIESFRMKLVGLPYLQEVIESIAPFALFNNTGLDVLGRQLLPGSYVLTITGYSQDYAQGSVVYGPVDTQFTIVSSTATISAPSFSLSSLCAGTAFAVNFTATGVFAPSNQFDVQLSNADGVFDNPIVIGSSPSAGVVNCVIPINIPRGSNYRIRVVSTSQIITGSTNASSLLIHPNALSLVSPTDDLSGGSSTLKATQAISATNKVNSPANVTYKAGNSILLNAGFQVNSNAVFKASIEGCN